MGHGACPGHAPDPQTTDDLMSYVQSFRQDVREIFEHFEFESFVQQFGGQQPALSGSAALRCHRHDPAAAHRHTASLGTDESLTILGQLGDRYTVLVSFQDADALLFGTSVTFPVRGFCYQSKRGGNPSLTADRFLVIKLYGILFYLNK